MTSSLVPTWMAGLLSFVSAFFYWLTNARNVDRGKGKAMTQKTLSLLWWSSYHLKWADHVFKVITTRTCRLNMKRHRFKMILITSLFVYYRVRWNVDRLGHLCQVSESVAGTPLLAWDLPRIKKYQCMHIQQ